MRPVPVILLRRRSISLLLCAFLAWDSCKEDFIEPENQVTFSQTEFYTLPESSIVIDLKSVVKKSFVSMSLTIAKDPLKGTLKQMDDFILKYTPNDDFTEGKDEFIFSAVLDDGTTVNSKPMTVYMKRSVTEFPCRVYSVEDNIHMGSTNTVVIHVLKNDRICGVNEPVDVFVHLPPKFGEAVVAGDSIIYSPGPSFSERDEFVYSLSASSGEEVSFGLVSINNSKFEVFRIPLGFTSIFFVDDTIGFIAGVADIQKTIDGGRHWIPLTYPPGEDDYVTFEDIYFLDRHHGFAVFSDCKWLGEDGCRGGWMTTRNGGVSWERVDLYHAVNSITFTSPLTGYMSTSQWDNSDNAVYHSVFKTVNGGETWGQVGDLYPSSIGKVSLRFASDNVGWAYQYNSIFSTSDGGITWTPFFTDAHVTSFALASDNVICASIAPIGLSGTTPSAIFRAESGSPFQTVINFPYMILSQGFSPEGELGIAIGISGPNPSVDPASQILTISTSTDRGKIWIDLADHPAGFPSAISVPSSNVAYILCSDKIIKYYP